MKDIVVFDLDGTLSLVGDRLKYLRQDPPDWESFYEACGEDLPNEPVCSLCRILQQHKILNFVTGRRESVRQKTVAWLEQQGIYIQSEQLLMRKDGDFRHDIDIKPELIESFKEDILVIFEDRQSMVDTWREMGLCCVQVAEGNF